MYKTYTKILIILISAFILGGCNLFSSSDDTQDVTEDISTETQDDADVEQLPEEERDDQRRADLQLVDSALSKYYRDNGGLAPETNSFEGLAKVLVPDYLDELPNPPRGDNYYYYASDDLNSYAVGAWSEIIEDQALTRSKGSGDDATIAKEALTIQMGDYPY